MDSKKKKCKIASAVGYVLGSIAVFAVATVVIFKGMPYLSGAINKIAVKRSNAKDDDDWEPVIEKKAKEKEEGLNDN